MFLGLIIGSLVAFDSTISDFFHKKHYGSVLFEFIPTFLLFGIFVGLIFLYVNLERLWEARKSILLLSLIISSQTKGVTSVGFLDLSDFVVMIFVIVWVMEKSIDIESRIKITFLFFLTSLFILSMIFSYIGQIGTSRASIISIIGPIKWLVIIFLISNYVTTKKDVVFFIKSFFAVTMFSGIVGIVESIAFRLFGIAFHAGRYDFQATFIGRFLRSQAFFGHIHGLATILAISLTSLFVLILYLKKQKIWSQKNVLLIFIITSIALLFTFYRGSWLAFLLAAFVCLFIRKPSWSIHFVCVASIFILIIWFTGLGEKFANKISQEGYTGDFKARLELNKVGVEGFIKKHPITGTGLRVSRVYTTHPSVYPAHNAFIQVADELGIFGVLFYLLIYLYLLARLIASYLTVTRSSDKIILQALIAGFMTFIMISQLEPLAYNFWFWVYFGLLEQSAICLYQYSRKETYAEN